ncbi:Protein-N(5)-glutamine methyltransferase PrmC, methylates polypeptide chain release factors RF1 and RF2 [Thioalkalivibrio nitratireducens DSM 14787]|uniref:Release factor glutamine methyltransferase n=1 Tax=Thioalkalivibrio nitratireducens (strain DSM 14787 / UNIQEM 213 / ALEN2) TaxID=1255043 RepID=L0DZC8_THIND|nr:peptide chain release factor N(5)-glutamine methyltransferase [Thioalkalivibrio nitratireducens]AGA34320.1 Protein-N(5)-glutamine methyltransferase PrmC, methylates polypeptide chain release factors RF1 and RF2 [Thioalkalivibrio nitratireducens DSM 14787]
MPSSRTTEPGTLAALLTEVRQRLQAAGIDAPGLESRRLVGHALGLDDAALFAHGERPVSGADRKAVLTLAAAREAGRPIAYLLGQREFWSLPLRVDEGCLIPRPETELLVERALYRIPSGARRVIDLGTGSGAIVLALKSERPDLEAWATELSAAALAVAAANASALGLSVHWLQAHWLEAFAPAPLFDAIISNPPYIDPLDPHLEQGDLRFEPRAALVAADRGLADLAVIAAEAREHLRPGGWLLLEHGYTQGPAVRTLLQNRGFQEITTYRDPARLDRVTEGRRPNGNPVTDGQAHDWAKPSGPTTM